MRNPDILVTFGDMRAAPNMQSRGNHPGLSILGRLKPGVTPDEVREGVARLAAAYRQVA